MHGLELRLSPRLHEGRKQLRSDEAVEEIKLDARVLEGDVDLRVRVREIGEEGEVGVEVSGGIDVDGVERGGGGVEGRIAGFDDEEDDEDKDDAGDEEEDEDDAEEGGEPD